MSHRLLSDRERCKHAFLIKYIYSLTKHLSANIAFLEMEELCGEKDNGLNFQDAKIKDLRSRIAKQKQIHKQLVSNLDIELKQEQYVARHLQERKTTETVARKKSTRR